MTDSEGRYQFDHLKPGDYFINIRTNGYLYLPPPDTTQPSSPSVALLETYIASNKITLHPNESATFDVTLQPSASLSGYVYFDDGSPAMNTEIRVEEIDPGPFYKPKPGEPSYMPILRIGDRGMTDDRGHFRITSLGTGTYRIAAAPTLQAPFSAYMFEPYLSAELSNELHQPAFLTVFSGDTIHRAQAKTYKLKPGDDVSDIRITIPLSNLYKIRGYVEAKDGRTPNEGLVTLVDTADPEVHLRAGLQKDGSFLFAAVPTGTYKLTMSQSFIAKPDTSEKEYNDDDTDIPTNAFSSVDSTIILKNSDILDLHFEVHEIPMPPKPPDDDDPRYF